MASKLNVFEGVQFEDEIVEEKLIAYTPATRIETFKPSDEIRISIEQRDVLTLICDSYLYIEGQLEYDKTDPLKTSKLTNNAFSFLFEEVKLALNGTVIESVRKPGITSTMKCLVSHSPDTSTALGIAGWIKSQDFNATLPTEKQDDKSFSAIVPLSLWFGFAEDYKKAMVWSTHELILSRSRTDTNCCKGDVEGTIKLTTLEWRVPQITLSDEAKLRLLNNIKQRKVITVPFRKRHLTIIPGLRTGVKDVLALGSVKPFETPRQAIIGFQTDKDNKIGKDMSVFDHADIINITLFINDRAYPSKRLNLNHGKRLFVEAYKMYADFQPSYYGQRAQPMLDYNEFLKNPLYVINCSNQNEAIQAGSVSIKVEVESRTPFIENTYAYILLLHDTIVKYDPHTSLVTTL